MVRIFHTFSLFKVNKHIEYFVTFSVQIFEVDLVQFCLTISAIVFSIEHTFCLFKVNKHIEYFVTFSVQIFEVDLVQFCLTIYIIDLLELNFLAFCKFEFSLIQF